MGMKRSGVPLGVVDVDVDDDELLRRGFDDDDDVDNELLRRGEPCMPSVNPFMIVVVLRSGKRKQV